MSDIEAIAQLILLERQGRDRGWWAQEAKTFWPEATIKVSWFDGSAADFIKGSKAMRKPGVDIGGHLLCAPVVQVGAERAIAEVPATIQLRSMIAGIEADLTINARLFYRLERRSKKWGILRIDAIYESDRLAAAMPGQSLPWQPSDFDGYRRSYRALTYFFARRGGTVPDDLYGEDRPEQLDAMYREAFAWAGLSDPIG